MTNKELLFSVTASDCEWAYTKGSGAGGQKRNKTSNAVHCSHYPSGAHAFAQDTRSLTQNKQLAFYRMVSTETFQKWLRLETQKRMGITLMIEQDVDRMMHQVKVEVKKDGKWTEESIANS